MIKTKPLKNNYIKIYSDTNKMIKHIPTREVHTEYVVKEYIEKDYIEIE